MNANKLKFEGIYTYQNQHLMYWGLSSEGNYLFFPYDTAQQKMFGIPGTLTESEVKKHIKEFDLSRIS